MNLSEAMHTVAVSGCRILADPHAGLTLHVPPGAELPSAVLDTLSAHRESIAAAFGLPPVPIRLADEGADPEAEDLADYLATQGIKGAAAEFVMNAADAFDVRHQDIRIEQPADDGPPQFFMPGIPCRIKIDTEWHVSGHQFRLIPAGTIGLAIPQPWAIADDFERRGLESLQRLVRSRRLARHVPVWLEGRPRAIELQHVEFDSSIPTAGMDLLPWRRTTSEDDLNRPPPDNPASPLPRGGP